MKGIPGTLLYVYGVPLGGPVCSTLVHMYLTVAAAVDGVLSYHGQTREVPYAMICIHT